MRVSTALIHDTAVGSIQDQQTKLLSLQQQVATGRRAVKPSDDPIATARALEVSQSKSVNNQFQLNQGYAKEALGLVENKLEGVKDILGYVRDQVVAAGNGTFSQSERDAVAIDLRARFDALLSLANSQDGKGEYVFSGFKGDTQPFAGGLSGVTYQGDQGERTMQVSTSRVLPVSNSGDEVFMKVPGSTEDLFSVISNFITDLEDPLAIFDPWDSAQAWPGLRLLVVSTTGDRAEYYVLDDKLMPQREALPSAAAEIVGRIAQNCEPSIATVLFMAGAGGSLRAGITDNPVLLTRAIKEGRVTVRCGGAPVYVMPGGGITFMVDVERMPARSFGSVPTPAIVAPIEFSMTMADYLDFGGHSDQVFSVDAALSRARTALQAPPRGYEVRTIGE